MEHRVKQRSPEWFKLRQGVMLTASQFADAVGVGKGKPFHFFQSLVESRGERREEDMSSVEGQMMHGQQMEVVIKEAYELLTGLRVKESGFWEPEDGHCLYGLIGASPDGVVVREKDASDLLGLVEFKAPVHKLYDQTGGPRHGIPRQYMVQVQGQMAVCGAPWCDFMAVCSKTEDVMLKRVYFQPRYWEHITARLQQFCFALEEAEIMRDLRHDVYGGAMTQRIKTLAMQDKLFPAEDLITVENLLTRSPLKLYRGPSQKVLSFQVLVGHAQDTPPALSTNGQDLLARVDAEIERKLSFTDISQDGEEEEQGRPCHRVFRKQSIYAGGESPETIFRDAAGMFGKENSSPNRTPSSDGPTVTSVEKPGSKSDKNLLQSGQKTAQQESIPQTNTDDSSSKQTSDPTISPARKLSRIKPAAKESGPQSGRQDKDKIETVVSKLAAGGGVRTAAPVSTPSLTTKPTSNQPARPGAAKPAPRPTAPVTRGRGVSQHSPRSLVPLKTTPPRMAARATMFPRPRLAGSGPRSAGPRQGARMTTPRPTSAVSRQPAPTTTTTASRSTMSGTTVMSTTVSPIMTRNTASASRPLRTTTVTTTRTPHATTTVTVTPASTPQSKGTAVAAANSTGTASSTSLTSSLGTTASQVQAKTPTVSARDEWEMSARGKMPASKTHITAETVVPPTTTTTAITASSQTGLSASKPADSKENTEARPGSDSVVKPTSDADDKSWSSEVLSSGSSFVPPGLTLLTSADSSSTLTDRDSAPSHMTMATTAVSSDKDVDRSVAFRQAQKRLATSASDVEAKRPLIEKSPISVLTGEREQRHSPERMPIHRPWTIPEGREHNPDLDRHMPRFGRNPDLPMHGRGPGDRNPDLPMHGRGPGERMDDSRDRTRDLRHQRLQPGDERLGARIQTLLDRSREDSQPRYDHQDHAHDFHRNRAPHTMRTNPSSNSVQYDNLRSIPLDLSDRHRHLDRDLHADRGPGMGREGVLGLDRGNLDPGLWRGQFQRQTQSQLRQQSAWPQHHARTDMSGARNLAQSNWPQGLRPETVHALDLQSQLRERHLLDLEARGRVRGPGGEFRGDLGRGQFSRNFPRRF